MTEISPKIFTLPNGIRVIYQERNQSLVSHCCLMINAGSRDERKNEQGLAHLIEHALFKGTKKRKAFHILSRLDSVGGELNASTTKEDTSIYASFLNEYFSRAIELIADISFNSTFPEKEVEKEKQVIIDEINSYLDNPSESIFDDFEELVFEGHGIGRNIMGTEKSVSRMGPKQIQNFVNRLYSGDQMVFSFVGNVPYSKFKKEVEKYLSAFKEKKGKETRIAFENYKAQNKVVKMDLHQAHLMMGNVAYDANHKKRHELIFLNNYLGGPAMNSVLSLKIREKYGIAYYIESGYTSYSDTGIFNIYIGTDQGKIKRAQQLVLKELKLLRNKKLSITQLNGAKRQLIGQFALGQDSGLNVCLAIGKSLLFYDKVSKAREIIDRIESIRASDLLDTANEIFDEKNLSSLTFV